MYESHFQLNQAPFSIAPDPEFLYLSDGHREAFAHLTYGLAQGGFVLITGEVGTGKTTLLRNMLKQMPEDVEVAFILNPRLTVRELLETICDELGIDYPRNERSSIKTYIDALNAHLLETHARGRSTVLIIDEAQNLAPAVLEQIRLLTNLETDKRKLLRVMLLGQPELLDLLARKELRQLAQRITARYHLRGLDRNDTFAYVTHRLKRAGGSALIFTRPALARLYRLSGGIPRLINLIADRSLLGAYAQGQHRVGWRMVGHAAREVLGRRARHTGRWIGAGIGSAALVGLLATWLLYPGSAPPDVPSAIADTATGADAADTSAAPPAPAVRTATDTLPPATGAASPSEASTDDTPVTPDTPATATAPTRMPEPAPTTAPSTDAAEDALLEPVALAAPATPEAATPDVAHDAAPIPPVAAVDAARNDAPIPVPQQRDQTISPVPPSAAGTTDALPVKSTRLERPQMTTFQSQRIAYQAAFARWGADFGTASLSTIPCDFAPSAGLQCLGGSGTWSDLRRFDLPAVLELWDAGSTPFYGALLAMRDDVVTLNVGGEALQFDVADLADNWFGGYVLLWKVPPDYRGSLKQGDRHSSVGWLRGQLEALQMAAPGADDRNLFDAALHEAVVRFQESESMTPDGVVGPQTMIRLNQRVGLAQPRLSG